MRTDAKDRCGTMLRLSALAVFVSVAAALLARAVAASSGGGAQQASGSPDSPAASIAPVLRDYKAVTADRLKHPADDDWIMVRRTYQGWGYSPLKQMRTWPGFNQCGSSRLASSTGTRPLLS